MKQLKNLYVKLNNIVTKAVDWVGLNLITSLIITFLLECLLRRSFINTFLYIRENTVLFLLNYWIVFVTLNLVFVCSKKGKLYYLISGLWLLLGIINFTMMSFRRTPLSAMDGFEIYSAIIHSRWYVIYVIVVSILMLLMIGCFIRFMIKWNKEQKITKRLSLWSQELDVRQGVFGIGSLILSIGLFFLIQSSAITTGKLSSDFGNLRNAYLQYGFAYCFSNSVLNHGIDKPKNYSKESITNLLDSIDDLLPKEELSKEDISKEDMPNVIMVQLESFFDVTSLKDITFSENPIPNFTNLRNNYSTGSLKVPSYGAGTANVEFEVLSSTSLKHFGTGEYPYRTYLQYHAMESAPYVLKELGYSTYAIHNNSGNFYKRDQVFKRLGFDYFLPLETMEDVEFNPTGWAKDKILTKEILSCLDASSGRDFVYTISVQPHNEYPETKITEHKITLLDRGTRNESLSNQLEYYVNQLHETDAFVGELVEAIKSYKEPTLLVLYGDHLPPMDLESSLTTDKYETEYVTFSNFDGKREELDVSTYQLIPRVLGQVGIHSGTMIRYQQAYFNHQDSEDWYQENMKLLAYDMWYGKKYVYNGTKPYKEVNMSIGLAK